MAAQACQAGTRQDRDARWTLKHSKAKPAADGAKRIDIAILLFSYKTHLGIDRRHGLIRTWTATDAARYDGAQLASLLDRTNTAGGVWTDTAYRFKKNETHLAAYSYTSRIHRKKPKGKPMPKRTARANARNSRSAPASSMSSPGRRGQWPSSSALSASPGRG